MNKTHIFIEKANKIHENKYDYSKVNYINSRIKVAIICKNHNEPVEFNQIPTNHIKGHGCPFCKKEKLKQIFNKSTDEFIAEVKNKYNFVYDSSKVKYINNKIKVILICNIHGEFLKSPSKILTGEGCPKCSIEEISNKFKKNINEFIKQANKFHNNKYLIFCFLLWYYYLSHMVFI